MVDHFCHCFYSQAQLQVCVIFNRLYSSQHGIFVLTERLFCQSREEETTNEKQKGSWEADSRV